VIKNELKSIISEAIKTGAKDIHFTKSDNGKVLIQNRSGNAMLPQKEIERSDYGRLLSYIRFNSALDLTSPLQPQSGSLIVEDETANLNCRIAILPTAEFQSLVIRVINHEPRITLDDLPLFSQNAKLLKDIAETPAGLIFLGGPTSRSKTTTAYTMIDYLKKELGKSVITIEEPIEYQQPDVVQFQVDRHAEVNPEVKIKETISHDYSELGNRTKGGVEYQKSDVASIQTDGYAGMNYEVGIKEILRHDPDVIFIDEIRNQSTAAQAIRAALTGHLVVSTIHSSDSLHTIHRMLDLGITVDDMNQSAVALVNQRVIDVDNGKGKKALMEIVEGTNLQDVMEQVMDGLVERIPYKSIDEEFLRWKRTIVKSVDHTPNVDREWVEVTSEADVLDDGRVSISDKTSYNNLSKREELDLD